MFDSTPTLVMGRRRILLAAALLAPLAAARAVTAGRPLRIVVGFPAGAGADGVARLVAGPLRQTLGAAVVVENLPGAGGRIAIQQVRHEPADGSVVLLVPDATMFLYPHVYKSLQYDPEQDFTPVARLVSLSLAMFIGPMVPAGVKTVAHFIDWARADSSRWHYGTPAAGATPHFAGALFARAAGLALTAVHFQGGAPGMQALAGGHLPAYFGSIADGIGLLPAGKVRALATTGSDRVAVLADTPTFSELGYRELVIEDGLGVHAPVGVPAAVAATLSAAWIAVMQAPDVRQTLLQRGLVPAPEGSLPFKERLQRERTRWAPLVRDTGFVAIE